MGMNLPVFLTGMDIVLATKRAATSACLQSLTGKHMISPSPATNLFALVHCMESSKMLQNIRRFILNRLSRNCLDNPLKEGFFGIPLFNTWQIPRLPIQKANDALIPPSHIPL